MTSHTMAHRPRVFGYRSGRGRAPARVAGLHTNHLHPANSASAESVLCALGDLARTRPAPEAPVAVVAAWYVAKAAVLDRIAASSTRAVDAETAVRQAEVARAHAHRLTSGGEQR